MLRTASIRLDVTAEQSARLAALRAAYADACNRLVPIVRKHRLWNRVALHQRAYTMLRQTTPLGSQMCCNAIFSVCKAYKAQKALGRIKPDHVPAIRFDHASVHVDARTYSVRGETVSLNTLDGRIAVAMRLGEHQRRILQSGRPKEAELVLRDGRRRRIRRRAPRRIRARDGRGCGGKQSRRHQPGQGLWRRQAAP
jgi:hypothetical protein